jgi:hypothetical protein
VTIILFRRYIEIIEKIEDGETKITLNWMCQTAIANSHYPIDKLSRWLGFVQGVLFTTGHISIVEERDFSRPLFHAAYKAEGLEIPPTLEVST